MFEINECICILQSGEQAILAFAHVQFEQFQTFDKFTTSLRHFGDGDPNGCPGIRYFGPRIVHREGKHLLHLYAGCPNSSMIYRMFAMLQ